MEKPTFIGLFDLETLYGLFGSFASLFIFIGGLPGGLYAIGVTGADWLVSTYSSWLDSGVITSLYAAIQASFL